MTLYPIKGMAGIIQGYTNNIKNIVTIRNDE